MLDDAVGEDMRLAGRDEQPVAGLRASVVSTSPMPSYTRVLERDRCRKTARDTAPRARSASSSPPSSLTKLARSGGPMHQVSSSSVGIVGMVELLQRVLDRAGDAGLGIRQRAVEVEDRSASDGSRQLA